MTTAYELDNARSDSIDHYKEPSLSLLDQHYAFERRHIGSDAQVQKDMQRFLGIDSLEDLLKTVVPESILQPASSGNESGMNEQAVLDYLRRLLGKNDPHCSFIGMGYYGTLLPNVILRNVLENPGWYTAYTPYQAEVAQGRLEMLMNFQQMTLDLTGMDVASASLLDEATAAAEAMSLAHRTSKNRKSTLFYVDEQCHPQTIDVIRTRAESMAIDVVIGSADKALDYDVFGAILAYPGTFGDVCDYRALISSLQNSKALVAMVSDVMSLVMLESPGELGADIALGSTQRFGVPMGFGGPHAAFFATKDKYKRSLPGRIIGLSVDSRGKPAYRMALQTREQHIRRDKATSNICTSQVLLANIAACYAVYHGPEGVKAIAGRIHRLTDILARGLAMKGVNPVNTTWFDTLTFQYDDTCTLLSRAEAEKINLRLASSGRVGVSLDEATTVADIATLWNVFLGPSHGLTIELVEPMLTSSDDSIPLLLQRKTALLTHEVFNSHHSETEMMRYLKRLEERDLTLNRSMIALGSCTMKLNAVTEMLPVTWPEIANVHPFVPQNQVTGLLEMIRELEDMLKETTGFAGVSVQPNSGAQGEYAGLLAIRRYHESRNDEKRHICLIPASAHGTNPASAIMCGMKVVVVECDKKGNVDMDDLHVKAVEHKDDLSALMITYPSTHGVYEEGIQDICGIVHENGGQVYMDGANMNALVCVAKPAEFGADVMHFNLHKTFCIPHGGGGPGVGPIGVAEHLVPFLPGHSVVETQPLAQNNHAVSAAPWGSAAILPISWSYMKMMGSQGLRKATAVAILNANYLARRLESHYPILYRGKSGWCAHEFIIDLRPIKAQTGVSEEDIAKRLIDFGFHAPTMSFPVAGTLMIEPTESESRAELDRFADAMIAIRHEIAVVERNELPSDNNPLVNAPHTLNDILETWERPYSREQGVTPTSWVKENKFWPSVNRVDNAYGDRNLICSCPSVEEYR